MVASAALRHPKLDEDGNYLNASDRDAMREKIRMMYMLAYQKGYDALVLSAYGCGAFGNPPHEVAQLFNEVNEEFWGCFKYIGFGVKSFRDPNYDIYNLLIDRDP